MDGYDRFSVSVDFLHVTSVVLSTPTCCLGHIVPANFRNEVLEPNLMSCGFEHFCGEVSIVQLSLQVINSVYMWVTFTGRR